jgi:hypothetical protein
VDNPAGTDVKELAREAMCLLRGGGIPLPAVGQRLGRALTWPGADLAGQ